MNNHQYSTFKDKYKDFDENYVFDIPLSQIELFQDKSQVRTNGVNPGHSAELTAQIERSGGNNTPITVEKLSSGGFGLVAGVHRLYAHRTLYDAGNQAFGTISAAYGFPEATFDSVEEKVIYQMNENTPPAQLPCDHQDYVSSFLELIKTQYIFGSNYADTVIPEKLRSYIRGKIDYLSENKIKNIARDIIAGFPVGQRKYRNYANKGEVAEVFNEINPWGIDVESSGDTDKGYAVYFAGAATAVKQNNLHGAFHFKTDHPNEKVLVVAYCGDVLTKTRDIRKWRNTVIKNVDKINSSPLLRSDVKLIDAIVFLPQVLRGDAKESQDALIIPSSTIVTPTP